jgi:hypothetical protein
MIVISFSIRYLFYVKLALIFGDSFLELCEVIYVKYEPIPLCPPSLGNL